MFLTVTPNPCIDKTVFIREFKPGDRVRAYKYTQISGGKGNNVARVLVTLGFRAGALLWVGGYTGKQVIKMLCENDRVTCFPVWTEIPTRTITTVLEEKSWRQTAFFEPGPKISIEEYQNFIQKFEEILSSHRIPIVVLSGTVPDAEISFLYKDLIKIANDKGTKVILDTYGNEFSEGIKSKPYMVKPNIEELSKFLNSDLKNINSRIEAIQYLHKSHKIPLVVLSMGREGALVFRDNTYFHIVPPKIKEINPVGSGDALVAGFAIGLHKKFSIEDTGRLGVALGTANAMIWDIGKFEIRDLIDIYEELKIYKINPINNQQVQYKGHTPLPVLLPKLKDFSP
ncbi:MAG: 1-phosphofructokinase family hexose kinase [Candidatus Hydrogenedens sp.]